MINHTEKKFIKYILSYINSSEKFSSLFNHHKQKYLIEDLFTALIFKLKTGISYNNFSYINLNIKGSNLYYFYKKLVKYNFFEEFFDYYIKNYVENMHEHQKEFYMDSTLIANKLGIDLATYNVQLKKHKSSKVSIVIDDYGVPIDYIITNSNNHDASILCDQITTIAKKFPELCTNNKVFIGDAGYDSSRISNRLKECNLGTLICDKNKRNTKDPEKLNKLKLDLYSKMSLKKRSKIEHTNNFLKQHRTVNVRYEKYSKNYNSFILLAIIKLAFTKIGIIEKYI